MTYPDIVEGLMATIG